MSSDTPRDYTFQDIREDYAGRDVITFDCNKCGERRQISFVYKGNPDYILCKNCGKILGGNHD